jgi:hypothetical protein
MSGTFRTNWWTATELVEFMWRGKRWWLTPIIVVLLLVSAMVVLLESSWIAPFIYALF